MGHVVIQKTFSKTVISYFDTKTFQSQKTSTEKDGSTKGIVYYLIHFMFLGQGPPICSEVLGQQQSLNAVSSQVAKELQSLQQKEGRDVVDWAGVAIFHQAKSKQIPTSCANILFS